MNYAIFESVLCDKNIFSLPGKNSLVSKIYFCGGRNGRSHNKSHNMALGHDIKNITLFLEPK